MAGRWRNVCFTINNPSFQDKFALELLRYTEYMESLPLNYIIYQEERGTNTGTTHIQGYMQLTKKVRLGGLRIMFGNWHFEQARGNLEQNQAYCTKLESRSTKAEAVHGEFGQPKRGQPTQDLREMLTSKEVLYIASDIATEHPLQFIRHHSGIEKLLEMKQPTRNHAPMVFIYYGPTASGKSSSAKISWPEAYEGKWTESGENWWWDGYTHQETVILDEFRHQIPLWRMIKFLDRYSFKVQVKGHMVEMNSKRIVITTNIAPENWYPKCSKEQLKPLFRRFKDFCIIKRFSEMDPDPRHISRNKAMLDEDEEEMEGEGDDEEAFPERLPEQDHEEFMKRIHCKRVHAKWSNRVETTFIQRY